MLAPRLRYLLDALLCAAALVGTGCGGSDEAERVGEQPARPTDEDPRPEPEPADPEGPAPALPPGRTAVVLLGTGTPNVDPERSGPCVAVVVDDVPYLVDMGPGLVRRAEAARRNGIDALDVARLSRVFVTHLHSDHTVGFPDLLYTPWVLGREEPLEVWGPPGIEEMAEHVREAWREDVRVRLDGLEPANRGGYGVVAHAVEPGVVYRDERVRVTAFPVRHGSWEHAYGYRFDTPGRSVVISGDTAPSDEVARACDGCDVLVHEVYSEARSRQAPEAWRRYHAAFHTSSSELAEVASAARPALLVLYHHLLWGASPEDLVAEVREGWDGNVVFGRDLGVH